jgi:hypothetical protein
MISITRCHRIKYGPFKLPKGGEFKPGAKNVRRNGHLDLPGRGQIEVQGD